MLNPADDITVRYVQDEEAAQQTARHRRIDRRADPARQAVLLRVVGAALRAPRRTTTSFSGGETGHDRAEADVQQRLRQGQLRPVQPPAHQLLGAVDADDVGRHAAGVRRARAQHDLQLAGVEPDPEDPRLRDPADQLLGHARLHAEQLVAAERARRLFRRQLLDTGVPTISSVVYQTRTVGARLSRSRPTCAAASGSRTRRACSCRRVRPHQARLRAGRLHQGVQRQGQRTTSRPASAIQHTSNDVDNTYPGGGYVFVWWDRAFTSSAPARPIAARTATTR